MAGQHAVRGIAEIVVCDCPGTPPPPHASIPIGRMDAITPAVTRHYPMQVKAIPRGITLVKYYVLFDRGTRQNGCRYMTVILGSGTEQLFQSQTTSQLIVNWLCSVKWFH